MQDPSDVAPPSNVDDHPLTEPDTGPNDVEESVKHVEGAPVVQNLRQLPVPAVKDGDNTEAVLNQLKASSIKDGKTGEDLAAVVVLPPDGGWGWVVVAASFVCNLLVDGIIFSFGVFLEPISTSLDASTAEVALVGSLLSGFYLLAGPFVSALCNKYGFRVVTMVGAVISSGALFLSTLFDSMYSLYFFYGLLGGIGFGLVYSPSILIVGFYFERWRALATGIAVCGSGIGMLLFAPMTTSLIFAWGWKSAVRVHAALLLLCVFCGLLFRPLPSVQVSLEADEENSSSGKKGSKKRQRPTAAERLQLANSTQSLTPSLIMTRVSALSGKTSSQSATIIRRQRTTSENSSVSGRSRRGTVTDCVIGGRRGTITKADDVTAANRPLYRDDIFFTGSLHRLPDYNSSQRDFMGYTLSVTRLPTRKDLEESDGVLCGVAVRQALGTLFDTQLLKSPSFLLLCASGFLSLMGIFTPFMYLTDRANQAGMEQASAAWLVSAVGVTNTLGRVICGILSSCPCVDALFVNNVALTIGGIATMASGVSLAPVAQFSYCALFGFMLACFASLRSILIVDLLGIEKLTNAFGILLLFQGFAAVLGAPLTGMIMESTGSYEWSFIVAGAFILLSAILCYPLNALSRWELRKKENPPTFV